MISFLSPSSPSEFEQPSVKGLHNISSTTQQDHSVIVTGFDPRLGEEHIKQALRKGLLGCGEITHISLTLARRQKQCFAVVRFSHADEVQLALKRSRSKIAGGVVSIVRRPPALLNDVPDTGVLGPLGRVPPGHGAAVPAGHSLEDPGTVGRSLVGHGPAGLGPVGHNQGQHGKFAQGVRIPGPVGHDRSVQRLQTSKASGSESSQPREDTEPRQSRKTQKNRGRRARQQERREAGKNV